MNVGLTAAYHRRLLIRLDVNEGFALEFDRKESNEKVSLRRAYFGASTAKSAARF
jgi:hypothetical protein